jgi:hypothetical protein
MWATGQWIGTFGVSVERTAGDSDRAPRRFRGLYQRLRSCSLDDWWPLACFIVERYRPNRSILIIIMHNMAVILLGPSVQNTSVSLCSELTRMTPGHAFNNHLCGLHSRPQQEELVGGTKSSRLSSSYGRISSVASSYGLDSLGLLRT